MNHSFFITLISSLLLVTSSYSQDLSFGFKGGLNYNANGDYFQSITDNAKSADANIGYHIGLFGKIGTNLYLRPELVYSSTTSDYNSDNFKVQKIDIPILVGIKIVGPLSAFAGPSFQYILNSEFEGTSINDIENDFSLGLNFGIGLDINKIGIDLRYERGFSNNEASFLNNNNIDISRINARPNQLILSLSLSL